jgi:subtilisin-like proprotein convertase family protein
MIPETQLDGYTYATTAPTSSTVYGSNFVSAWNVATGTGVTVGLIDSGFDPTVLQNWSSLSWTFVGGGAAPPSGTYHGITTSGVIGAPGSNSGPIGVAVNSIILGLKVAFGNFSEYPFSTYVEALTYGAKYASAVNNSWAISGYGQGAANQSYYAPWYSALQTAVSSDRNGLGTIVVMAGGNDRADANDVGLQPITSDPREIAVAASTSAGVVASFSTPGAGLLTSAIGVNVLAPEPGLDSDQNYYIMYGTSFSAPQITGLVALMLQANPNLGWRDVQEIIADASYAPPPSAAGFVTNGATGWNGGGMHFSNDLGFGVVDANVAVNLALAWTEQSTSANLLETTAQQTAAFKVNAGTTAASRLQFTTNERIQHVQVTLNDTGLLAAYTKLILVSPDGTQSVLINQTGMVSGTDETGGLDLTGNTITSNAFWGENAQGTWTLEAQNLNGTVATVSNWSLTVWGDAGATVADPLVYTPEFAALAASSPARQIVSDAGTASRTLDLIALPNQTTLNLNGGAGVLDGVAVTVKAGLLNVNAEGSTGALTITTAAAGSSVVAGNGTTTIYGGGGSDTIQAGSGAMTAWMNADTKMSFIGSSGTETVYTGSGQLAFTAGSGNDTIVIQAGSGATAASSNTYDVLTGLTTASDHIQFSGYSSLQVAMATFQDKSDGNGGTLVTMSSGARIDFVGISQSTTSQFMFQSV